MAEFVVLVKYLFTFEYTFVVVDSFVFKYLFKIELSPLSAFVFVLLFELKYLLVSTKFLIFTVLLLYL